MLSETVIEVINSKVLLTQCGSTLAKQLTFVKPSGILGTSRNLFESKLISFSGKWCLSWINNAKYPCETVFSEAVNSYSVKVKEKLRY